MENQSPKPTIGRIVQYRLSSQDVHIIESRRSEYGQYQGNAPHAGDTVPLLITAVWSDTCVNGRAFVDGNDDLWVSSVTLNPDPKGKTGWCWPPRV